MRAVRTAVAGLALCGAIAAPAIAATTHRAASAAHAKQWTYVFRGLVAAAPGSNASTLSVQLQSGDRQGIRAITAANATATPQAFVLNAGTKILYAGVHGKLVKVGSQALQTGDPVVITVNGPAGADLASILQQPVLSVRDLLNVSRPGGRMFLYEGPVVSTAPGAVTINVDFGNWRALYSMLGQPTQQTFKVDASTAFVHWAGGKRYLIQPTALKAGDRVTIRVFSPNWSTKLATIEQTPAWRVNDHEPQSSIDAAIGTSNQ